MLDIEKNATSAELAIGSIFWYVSTTPPNLDWLLCDGSDIDILEYPQLHSICRGVLPSMNGQFVRGTATPSDITFAGLNDTTSLPNNNFVSNTTGNHNHQISSTTNTYGGGGASMVDPLAGNSVATNSTGAHTHTIGGGGDSETRPNNVRLAPMIKGR